jgi:uncharacterized membrane protein
VNFALSMTLLVLAVAGFGLSLYLAVMSVRVRRGEVVWCVDTACPVVMRTQYAAVLRFPNAVLALPFYASLAAFAALGMAGAGAWLLPAVSVGVALAAAMSVYLIYALLAKLRSP